MSNSALLALAVPMSFLGACASQPSLVPLPDLPGGPELAYAYDISGNGKTITGESWDVGDTHGRGVRWTKSGSSWSITSFGLPTNPPGALNSPAASSDRGAAVFVGRCSFEPLLNGVVDTLGYVWRPGSGFGLLPNLPTDSVGAATCAAENARSVFGYGWVIGSPQYENPYPLVWTKPSPGSVMTVARLDPLHEGMAQRAEHRGQHVVGWARSAAVGGNSGSGREAVCWTRRDLAWSPEWLGFLPGYTAGSSAMNISRRNGHWAVGLAADANGLSRPVRWQLASGYKQATLDLGLPTGMAWAAAAAVSQDGRRVVGSCSTGADDYQVFVWDQGTGMSLLRDIIPKAGTDWTNMAPTGISDNGRVVCGYGTHRPGGPGTPEVELAWVATLP